MPDFLYLLAGLIPGMAIGALLVRGTNPAPDPPVATPGSRVPMSVPTPGGSHPVFMVVERIDNDLTSGTTVTLIPEGQHYFRYHYKG